MEICFNIFKTLKVEYLNKSVHVLSIKLEGMQIFACKFSVLISAGLDILKLRATRR